MERSVREWSRCRPRVARQSSEPLKKGSARPPSSRTRPRSPRASACRRPWESGGTAIAVTDEELLAAVGEIGAAEGLFVAPEGAACLPALRKLIERGEVSEGERIVLFNTGAGVKYLESFGG